ncbi:trypsin-like peptidase domain-containing protein [Leptolyngbya sp. FACHB-711]|uniref:trypsin-like peptidase domain-containing protein n=1 Tax=Leptolyngbya sp. FACHB-711 TaxID=2692813 RepID=UPI001684F4E0|nr:trypsin-like peptidase domain-containing protein [Leptolyngbya sp. FACHB-711]MBD2025257.1 trypsin-like peptidase domain-containing protein [Leptolyngbya sp. FACHB-711]
MAADTEQREILAELRELKAEFAAVHKRLDKLDSIDQTTKRTERKTNRGFAAIGETLAWQDLIQNLILYGVCLASVSVVTSIGVIRSEVCPKAPGWALHLIPFGNVICAGTADKPAVNADPIVALRRAIIGQESNGNHTAMNASGSGATGLGQVMPENIAAWSQQCIGRSLSQDEFKGNADLQLQIIDCKLKEYWNQVDGDDETRVRKVASMWYSGQSAKYDDSTPQSWAGNSYPSIREYTLKVLERWKKELQSAPISSTAAGKATPFKGIQVTSAKDASGEPGLDYVVSGGQRGAEFGALAAGSVVEVVADQNWESHLEAGGTQRGYGNLVVVRVNEAGNEIDMLYAHLDRVDVKEGDRIDVGTVLGTQGRTGSTTAPHVSVDFFAPGTRTANAASLAMRDRIAGILASNPDSLNGQVQTAQTPAPAADKPMWDFSGVRLPFFQPPAPAVSSKPENSVPGIQQPEGGMCGSVAVAPDRLITAAHCIKSSEVTIVPQSGEWLKGTVVKQSAETDLALIQVDGANFPVLPMGSSPQAGEAVTAIGYPLVNGSKLTVTPSTVQATEQFCGKRDMRCFSVPSGVLSGGFSGGGMVNARGELVGINRAIGEANGIGYAIPIDVVKEFAQ